MTEVNTPTAEPEKVSPVVKPIQSIQPVTKPLLGNALTVARNRGLA